MKRVNIEQAIKLKELGYRIPTEYYYDSDNHKFIGHSETGEYDFNDPEYLAYDIQPKIKSFSAPYIAEALEWIRNEKEIPCSVEHNCTIAEEIVIRWFGSYGDYVNDFNTQYSECFDTYEEAESALLDELLIILEESK